MKKNAYQQPLILNVARERAHDEAVAALRDGRKQRAATFANRKKVANKRACRGRVSFD